MDNIFSSVPKSADSEVFEDLLKRDNIRIERIVSRGQVTPEGEWYDQEEHEWVMVLSGAARLLFEDGREVSLEVGSFVNIPAGVRHRVSWTHPDEITVWLAVFYC